MRFGSVCSGIEAASQAWQPLGWKAAWLSEIEPFPCALLAHHYPDTPNFGDMTQFESWPDDEQHAIDLLCGGTPCQSFSVAGLRKGLDDDRGNLMLTFAAIAAKYRPKWLVWENVPGVLSSNNGRDFASFLGLLSGQSIEAPQEGWGNSGIITGYHNAYSLAYRVLDAQYFGVAQRRNRVFVVGCLGANRSAAAVLFERHSLSGDIAPSREKGQGFTRAVAPGAFTGGASGRPEGAAGNHFIPTVASGKPTIGCLMANAGTKLWLGNQEALTGDYHILHPVKSYGIAGNIIGRQPENGGNGNGFSEEISYTLTKTDQHGVVAPIAYAFDSLSSNSMKSSNPLSGCNETNIAKTIDTSGVNPACNQGGNAVLQPIAWSEELTASTMLRGEGFDASEDGTGRGTPLVPVGFAQNQRDEVRMMHVAGALAAEPGMKQQTYALINACALPASEYNKGFNTLESLHACTQENNTIALLRRVQKAIGAQAFTQWGLGILDSLQSPEILRSALHGSEFRPAPFSRRWVVCCALGSPFSRSAGAMHSMREAAGEGCTPQGWGFSEQHFDELGAYLSQLPQPGAQAERLMRDLWQAAEGVGLLRNALSAVQKARRPAGRERQPVYVATQGLGTEPAEVVQGAGLHGQVPREGVLQQARAAGSAGDTGTAATDQARISSGAMAVRRLVVEECEFLQGFARGYTNIPHRGKPAADGNRYKALGNSWAVPCVLWIGERIQMVEDLEACK